MPKKNDILTVKIENMTNLGFGVAKCDGKVVFVSDAVKGDVAEVRIIKVYPSYLIAKLKSLLTPSDMRVEGRCGYGKCKSCAYREIDYAEERKIKANDVKEAFMKAGLKGASVAPLVASPKICEYRNKAQYPISRTPDGEYIIGYFAPKTHRICEARYCPLTPRIFGEICDTVSDFAKKYGIDTYDEESGKGLLRHVYLRRGEVSGEILLTLVINGASLPHSGELTAAVIAAHPDVVGILINENRERTNVVLGKKYTTIYGKDHITDTLAGVELKITPASFYQVNHDAAELLYGKAKELAQLKSTDTLLDLYCGTGSIGLSMAKDVKELFGVEIVESAVECARENARRAGIGNATFFAASADDTEKLLNAAEKSLGRPIVPDVVILDPPRGGCGEECVRYVASLAPERIVYISCNPVTLARDVKLFTELGYSYGEITPFDLFPATGHVESVVALEARKDTK